MSIFTSPLEPILCEISDERKSLRPAARRRGSANGSRAKNFLPPTPSIFCPLAKKSSCEKLLIFSFLLVVSALQNVLARFSRF